MNNLFGYDRQQEFIKYLTPYQFSKYPMCRIGSNFDGGYVVPENIESVLDSVVSIGVGRDNSTDLDLARRGIKVVAWDHTVNSVPKKHRNIDFKKLGLGSPSQNRNLRSLSEITAASNFGSDARVGLFLDAEGAEWYSLDACSDEDIQAFDVLVVELHNLGDLLLGSDLIMNVLKRLNRIFVPTVVHVNNYSATWNLSSMVLPDTIEVTYINRDLVTDTGTIGNGAAKYGSPCCQDLDEIFPSWC